uniref:SSD domain-containing protein n=1 Tax=Panagrolaimus sp. ES5 TaxID=591445 RepID=A0AC34G340_9BILA
MRNFWNSSGDPSVSIILLTARDNGSMIRLKHLEEVVSLHNYLLYNFTVEFENEQINFNDLCYPYCNINYGLNIFYEGLLAQTNLHRAGKPLNDETILSFPISKVNGFKINIEKSLFGVTKKQYSSNRTHYLGGQFDDNGSIEGKIMFAVVNGNQTLSQSVTDIDYVKVIMLLFRGDQTTQRKGEILSKWQTSVYNFSLMQYSNPLIEMQVFGAEVLDYEMMRDGLRLAPYFALGFGLMVSFVVITVNGTALLYGKFDFGKIMISFGATISSLMAVSTTYGLLSLIGFRLNSISLVLPFLVCGIGVDDAFLMIHSWQKLSS